MEVWEGKADVTNAVSVFQFQVGKAALWAAEQMFRSTDYLMCGLLSTVFYLKEKSPLDSRMTIRVTSMLSRLFGHSFPKTTGTCKRDVA